MQGKRLRYCGYSIKCETLCKKQHFFKGECSFPGGSQISANLVGKSHEAIAIKFRIHTLFDTGLVNLYVHIPQTHVDRGKHTFLVCIG